MSGTPDKRISAIRQTIRAERALFAELNGRISADLQQLLMPASGFLDDAEGWLAPEVLRHPPRSDAEWRKWLKFVTGIVDRAIEHRKWVERLVRKYGRDARVVR